MTVVRNRAHRRWLVGGLISMLAALTLLAGGFAWVPWVGGARAQTGGVSVASLPADGFGVVTIGNSLSVAPGAPGGTVRFGVDLLAGDRVRLRYTQPADAVRAEPFWIRPDGTANAFFEYPGALGGMMVRERVILANQSGRWTVVANLAAGRSDAVSLTVSRVANDVAVPVVIDGAPADAVLVGGQNAFYTFDAAVGDRFLVQAGGGSGVAWSVSDGTGAQLDAVGGPGLSDQNGLLYRSFTATSAGRHSVNARVAVDQPGGAVSVRVRRIGGDAAIPAVVGGPEAIGNATAGTYLWFPLALTAGSRIRLHLQYPRTALVDQVAVFQPNLIDWIGLAESGTATDTVLDGTVDVRQSGTWMIRVRTAFASPGGAVRLASTNDGPLDPPVVPVGAPIVRLVGVGELDGHDLAVTTTEAQQLAAWDFTTTAPNQRVIFLSPNTTAGDFRILDAAGRDLSGAIEGTPTVLPTVGAYRLVYRGADRGREVIARLFLGGADSVGVLGLEGVAVSLPAAAAATQKFTFDGTERQRVRVQTSTGGLWWGVRAPDGRVLVEQDGGVFVLPMAGTYTVMANPDSVGPAGGQVSFTAQLFRDPLTTTLVRDQEGSLTVAAGQDAEFAFDGIGGEQVTLTGLDANSVFLAPDGLQLETLASYVRSSVTVTLPTTGTYRFRYVTGTGPGRTFPLKVSGPGVGVPTTIAGSTTTTTTVGTATSTTTTVAVGGQLGLAAASVPGSGAAPLAVTLSASADETAGPVTYSWTFGDGSSGSGKSVSHSFVAAGSYRAVVRAERAGRSESFTVAVNVADGALTAALDAYDVTAIAGTGVEFNAASSTGAITGYTWDFGDGGSGSGVSARHAYAAEGNYTVRLTVSDGSPTGTAILPAAVRAGLAPLRAQAGGGGGGSATTSAPVHVVPRSDVLLHVTGTGGAVGIVGADLVLQNVASHQEFRGVSGADGKALLPAMPDGAYLVYGYAPGYKPRQTNLTFPISTATNVELEAGDAVKLQFDPPQQLTLAQITAAGIDVSKPENRTVVEFTLPLGGASLTICVNDAGGEVACPVKPGGGGGGGGSGSGGVDGGTASSAGPGTTVSSSGGNKYYRTVYSKTFVQVLRVRSTASFVKEFFDVRLIAYNASTDAAFTVAGGSATIRTAAGMTVMPGVKIEPDTSCGVFTASPVGADEHRLGFSRPIPAGGCGEAAWIVRGDVEGDYGITALFEGILNPFDRVIYAEANVTGLKVWGSSGFNIYVQPRTAGGATATGAGSPWTYELCAENKSTRTINDLVVELEPPPQPVPPDRLLVSVSLPRTARSAPIAPGATSCFVRNITVTPTRADVRVLPLTVRALVFGQPYQGTVRDPLPFDEPVRIVSFDAATRTLSWDPIAGVTKYEVLLTDSNLLPASGPIVSNANRYVVPVGDDAFNVAVILTYTAAQPGGYQIHLAYLRGISGGTVGGLTAEITRLPNDATGKSRYTVKLSASSVAPSVPVTFEVLSLGHAPSTGKFFTVAGPATTATWTYELTDPTGVYRARVFADANRDNQPDEIAQIKTVEVK